MPIAATRPTAARSSPCLVLSAPTRLTPCSAPPHAARRIAFRRVVTAASAVEAVDETDDTPVEFLNYNKTYYPKKVDTNGLEKPWFLVNADGQILGAIYSGKLNPAVTSSMDMGAYIVVINAEKVTVSGRKYTDKVYYRHTVGRPGKAKRESFKTLQNRLPERIIENAVKGMLPKGRLGKRLFHHLKIYTGDEHPHSAQQPKDITVMINAKPSVYGPLLAEIY